MYRSRPSSSGTHRGGVTPPSALPGRFGAAARLALPLTAGLPPAQ